MHGSVPHAESRGPADEGIIANGAENSLSLMAVDVFPRCFHPNDLKSVICRRVLLGAVAPWGLSAPADRHSSISPRANRFLSLFFLHCDCLIEKCDLDCVFCALMGRGADSTRMTIARSEEEEKSRSAFTHIGDRDSSVGPLSVTLLLFLSAEVEL